MGDRIAVLKQGGVLAQYATPGGAADGARRRLRRGLRRRRPRAQAPGADARERGRAAAGRQRPALHARARRERAPGGVGAAVASATRCARCTATSPCATRSAISCAARSSSAPSSTARGVCRACSGWMSSTSCSNARTRRERSDDPRPVRRRLLPRPLAEHQQLRGEQRLLPGLDRPPPRPLRVALLAAPVPGRRVGRPRLRDRLRPRAARRTASAGSSARSPRSRGSSTRSPASPSSSCCCRSPGAATPRRSSR